MNLFARLFKNKEKKEVETFSLYRCRCCWTVMAVKEYESKLFTETMGEGCPRCGFAGIPEWIDVGNVAMGDSE